MWESGKVEIRDRPLIVFQKKDRRPLIETTLSPKNNSLHKIIPINILQIQKIVVSLQG